MRATVSVEIGGSCPGTGIISVGIAVVDFLFVLECRSRIFLGVIVIIKTELIVVNVAQRCIINSFTCIGKRHVEVFSVGHFEKGDR
jgi:hypothetical protein